MERVAFTPGHWSVSNSRTSLPQLGYPGSWEQTLRCLGPEGYTRLCDIEAIELSWKRVRSRYRYVDRLIRIVCSGAEYILSIYVIFNIPVYPFPSTENTWLFMRIMSTFISHK
jgi:hypothetical protein